jgi:penicillin-binding protein 1A
MVAGRRSPRKKKKSWLSFAIPKRRSSRKKFSLGKWLLRWSFKWSFVCGIWAFVIGAVLVTYYSLDLPDLSKLFEVSHTQSITVLDRDGTVIGQFGQLTDRNIAFEEIPQTFVDAVTSTEDRRFFSHFGIDMMGLMRAAYVNFRAGHIVQGGSTVTQQLVKVVLLKPERTLKRKIQEVILSFYLEKHFTKQQIFTMYANRVYLGAGNYGIESASRFYFDKDAKHLNLYESAMLAGLIQAPSRYSPTNNPELTEWRTNQVLMNMYENEKLTSREVLSKKTGLNPRAIQEKKKPLYPYFAHWIREQLPDYIGASQEDIIVKTTFDNHIQDIAEKSLTSVLEREGPTHKASQGAVVVLSKTGDILAMVGGVDAAKSEFNRATQALRQPGSAFKLFVYLAALEQGFSPQDMTVDAPISVGKYRPRNFNNKYEGEIPLDYAFAHSINTVAVRLAQQVGIRQVINVATRLGITSPITADLSSALGSSEVNLLELTSAYAHLANSGNAVWLHAISSVAATNGKVLYSRNPSGSHRVLSANVVGQMNEMLMKVVESGTGKRAQIDRPVAAKTGTSQNSRDAWFVGFTSNYVAGVWVGNDNNHPMKNVVGGGLPAQIWKEVMVQANAGKPVGFIPTTAQAASAGSEEGIMSLWGKIFGEEPNTMTPPQQQDVQPSHEDIQIEGWQVPTAPADTRTVGEEGEQDNGGIQDLIDQVGEGNQVAPPTDEEAEGAVIY